MKTIWLWTQTAFAGLGGLLGWYLGGMDGALYALIAFVVVDYICGVLKAIVERKLSSRIGSRGIARKVAIFLVVGIGHLADLCLFEGDGDALRTAVIFFYIANEGLSILENLGAIGVSYPKKLKDVLAQLRSKHDNDEEVDAK
jgi:toxin secretion/phage lysis holin